jgi:hypothetical protein
MKRYLVMVMRNPQFDATLIAAHGAFLDDLRRQGRLELAGPFSDGSGGAYLLRGRRGRREGAGLQRPAAHFRRLHRQRARVGRTGIAALSRACR